ncbi:right-handed parallel beta-helix repeat-containing protein [bacterium]|nr:right-handed parallel beta-helix repeat-containing protein [bacterium]
MDQPFGTLRRARNAIRALKQHGPLPAGGVTVWIRGGRYQLSQTFKLTAADSGTAAAQVVYRAYESEEVRLSGGHQLTGWQPVTDPAIQARFDPAARDQIWRVDLKAQGVTDYGDAPVPIDRDLRGSIELFSETEPMVLARWPNDGYVSVAGLVNNDGHSGEFLYDADRPRRWADPRDAWMHGYWAHDWWDSYVAIDSIDTDQRLIRIRRPHPSYGIYPGHRYYALNILEELDSPREWYLDRQAGILYFWPPEDPRQTAYYVSTLRHSLVSMKAVSHVSFRELTFEVGRGPALEMRGSSSNLVAGCVIRNVAGAGVAIAGGTHNGVVGCDIYQVGLGGIGLTGGDRRTLRPANHYVRNTRIHRFGRLVQAYRPGITLNGVGHHVAHNAIYDGPHCAILLHANDCLIEYNDIHDVCTETADAGAIYTGRDISELGNVIRHNYIHDMSRGSWISAVYLDDWASGFVVEGNIFARLGRAVTIAAGLWNVVTNNICWDVEWGIVLDQRGKLHPVCIERLEAVNYRRPPYSDRYPQVVTVLDEPITTGVDNRIERNILSARRPLHISPAIDRSRQQIADNLTNVDPQFADPATFRLADTSPALSIGFRPIPFAEIGLRTAGDPPPPPDTSEPVDSTTAPGPVPRVGTAP